MRVFLPAFLSHAVVAMVIFGSPLAAVLILVDYPSNGFHAVSGFAVMLFAIPGLILCGALAAFRIFRRLAVMASLLVSFPLISTVVANGWIETTFRNQKIAGLDPDGAETKSFWWSLWNTPRDFQFEIHAAVWKNCVPYGYSYKLNELYEIPHNAAKNVMPDAFLAECPEFLKVL